MSQKVRGKGEKRDELATNGILKINYGGNNVAKAKGGKRWLGGTNIREFVKSAGFLQRGFLAKSSRCSAQRPEEKTRNNKDQQNNGREKKSCPRGGGKVRGDETHRCSFQTDGKGPKKRGVQI